MEDPRRYPATQDRRASLLMTKEPAEKTRHMAFPALPERIKPGDTLGELRIEREISSGSTATIFAAVETVSGRSAALKVLSPHLAVVPEAVSRFKTEASLQERIEHPSILPVYGSGKDKCRYFFAMRLESGLTAESLMDEACTGPDEAFYHRVAGQFAQVADALGRLHENGIVHRDIKPENLLMGADGEILLCDFGSALDSNDRSECLEQSLWGTVRYMSPEQLRPSADPYCPSMDIYALGMSLYECVVGVSPFPRATEGELIRFKLTRIPPNPNQLNHRVPLGLDAIIRQAMEPGPLLRYPSATDLAEDLARFAEKKRGHKR